MSISTRSRLALRAAPLLIVGVAAGCSRDRPKASPAGTETSESPPVAEAPVKAPLPKTLVVDVGTESAPAVFAAGWSGNETWGGTDGPTFRWTLGLSSSVDFEIDPDPDGCILEVVTRAALATPPERVEASINGHLLGSFVASSAGALHFEAHQLLVGKGVLNPGQNTLKFTYAYTKKPSEFDPNSGDTRDLAVAFDRISFLPMRTDATLDLGDPAARDALGVGFGADERLPDRSAALAPGRSASLRLRLKPSADRYFLEVVGAPVSGAPQTVAARLNDTNVGALRLSRDWAPTVVEVRREALRSGDNVLELARTEGTPDVRYDFVGLTAARPAASVAFGDPGARAASFLTGWGGDERDGTGAYVWSIAPSVRVLVVLAPGAGPYQLGVRGWTIAPDLEVAARINGNDVGTLRYDADQHFTATVPDGVLVAGANLVELRFSKTVTPARATPGSHDDRALALAVRELTIAPAAH